MFVNKTVFILGAGASWHYGYPTGEELVKRVIEKAKIARNYFNQTPIFGIIPNFIRRNSSQQNAAFFQINDWKAAAVECTDLIDRLTSVDPLVIDYFLGQNPHLEDIGKLCVAWVLLESEAEYLRGLGNPNRPDVRERLTASNPTPITGHGDNWYRFLIHKLVTGCPDAASLFKNQVAFVTFNYDVSVEFQLFKGLNSLAQFPSGDVRKFLQGKVIHVYGKLREDPFAEPPEYNWNFVGEVLSQLDQDVPYRTKELLDLVYAASKGIRIIAPHKATTDTSEVLTARAVLSAAQCAYILGYGFDPFNSRLLDLQSHLDVGKHKQTVMFTNFGNHNRVNKQASRVLFRNRRHFWGDHYIEGGQDRGFLVEKSVNNVYDALAQDFDSPEEDS